MLGDAERPSEVELGILPWLFELVPWELDAGAVLVGVAKVVD